MGQVNHRLREALDAEKAVRVFGGQEYERRRFVRRRQCGALRNFKFGDGGRLWPGAILQIVIAVADRSRSSPSPPIVRRPAPPPSAVS